MNEELVYRDRRNTACEKWDGMAARFGREDLLALWVADMDFQAPRCVRERLREYVDGGTYGYYVGQESWKDAFLNWQRIRHGVDYQREWLRVSPGVVAAVNWMIRLMTRENDAVALLTPVYYPFFSGIRNNGRRMVTCPLRNNGGTYSVDYEAFENLLTEEQVRLFLLCSPHNPVGRVWTREELGRLSECCFRHGVRILSDEIHQDLTFFDHRQIPILSAVKPEERINVVAATSATKTFNLAALQNAILTIPDPKLREGFDALAASMDMTEGNAVGYLACESAYRSGASWLESLRGTIEGNYLALKERLAADVPEAVLSPLEGTYLAWLDLSRCLRGREIQKVVQDESGLAVDYGSWFGGEAFENFIRMNLATSRENILAAADALCRSLRAEN